ncbi:MAG TPA: winged helix-turn-helix domain-containing protein [Bryobacteraceae bacterium]|nr:winged helix-turn-helix domain-containing protein [Bryobacteraceae bacterium]
MSTGQEDVKSAAVGVSRKVRFGTFEVDLDNQDLRKDGQQVKLERKPFQLMELLLRIRGRFVSRAELTRALWPDLHVNFERSLNTAVNSLRKALGDSPQNPSYIETKPGLGYRFIAPVQEIGSSPPAAAHASPNENCAKARYFLNKLTQADLHKASAYLQAALDEDSRCVRAYADLAETYCLFARMNMATPDEAGERARSLAAVAVELDPGSVAARAALGSVKQYFDWDWAGAADEFRKAIALDPGCASVHKAYGSFLSSTGNMQAAVDELHLAQRLDPISPAINAETAWVLYLARDFAAAHEQCWKVLALEPSFSAAQHVLGLVHEQMGMCDEAVIEFQNAQSSGDEQPAFVAALGHAWAKAGKVAKAKEALRELRGLSAKRYVSPYWHAIVCAALGQGLAAVEWLEKGFEQRDVWLAWLGVDPRFDDLRSSAGFQSVLQQMRFDVSETDGRTCPAPTSQIG